LDELVKARQIVPDGPNAYKVAKASLKITIGPGKGGTASATGEPMTQDEAFAAIKKFFEKRNRDRCENVLVFPDGTIDLKDYEGHIDDIRSMLVGDEFLVLEQPEHVEGGILYRELDIWPATQAAATGREIATAVRDALNHQYIEAVAILENVRQAGDLDGIKEAVDGYREGVDLSAKAAKNVADADQANRLTREVLDTLEYEFEIAEAFYNGEFFNAPTVGKAVQLVDGYVEGVRERLAKAEEKVNIAAEAEKRNALISGLDADSTSRVKRMLVRIGFYDDEEHIKIIDGELTFEALEQARQLYSIVITQDNANDPLNMYMQDSEGVQQMSVAANIEDLKKQVEAWISV